MTNSQGGFMQNGTLTYEHGAADIRTFVRNRYFYGKLMDVAHFETEQTYFNEKRWLLNRLIGGYGVVCGLNVGLTEDGRGIWVDPGVAIDKAGHEIVVPARSKPLAVPDAPPREQPPPQPGYEQQKNYGGSECEDEGFVHLAICFHECESDPEPVRAGDCEDASPCAPGSIRERYKITLVPWKAPKIHCLSTVEDLISGGRLNYEALANHITANCAMLSDDCCIPLANLKLPQPGQPASPGDIDITIRPIVYTNDLLFELILAFPQAQNRPRQK
jgi:hypothetical protein